ncbi:MAG: hypothetical protein LAO08_19115 [Acidobacteriia bacterium]|nr:hypothetical protein [Terriglobia bacterium]
MSEQQEFLDALNALDHLAKPARQGTQEQPVLAISLEGMFLKNAKRSDLFEWLFQLEIPARQVVVHPGKGFVTITVDAVHGERSLAILEGAQYQGVRFIAKRFEQRTIRGANAKPLTPCGELERNPYPGLRSEHESQTSKWQG